MRREDLQDIIPGLDTDRYLYALQLLEILWRSIWWSSTADWGRYRREIWTMFANWTRSSARRSRDISGFLANFSRYAQLQAIGTNAEEREVIARLLALPYDEQRQIIRQFRNEGSTIHGIFRVYRDARKTEIEAIRSEESYEEA
ncbi:MAG: hypothetical protein D6706_18445 [Chloroflexi bacterium]|nr:MAG: hypothetical protein D6706_18445 [Chloroflexota bacterium]